MSLMLSYAVAALVVSYEPYIQPSVAQVRAAPNDNAAVISRLTMGRFVRLHPQPKVSNGYIEVTIENDDGISGGDIRGFVKARELGPKPQPEDILANDEKLDAKAPFVVGVCFRKQVVLLAELKGTKFQSLVAKIPRWEEESPATEATLRRLWARALDLTTIRFYRTAGGQVQKGYLSEPKLMASPPDYDFIYHYITMGHCPWVGDEGPVGRGVVVISAPIVAEPEPKPKLNTAELGALLLSLKTPFEGAVHVYQPGDKVVEIQANQQTHLFSTGSKKPFQTMNHASAPFWMTLSNGTMFRVSGTMENVSTYGWGNDGVDGLYLQPIFSLMLVAGSGGTLVEGTVQLMRYET